MKHLYIVYGIISSHETIEKCVDIHANATVLMYEGLGHLKTWVSIEGFGLDPL